MVHHQLQPLEEGDRLVRLELRGLWGAEQISPLLELLKQHPLGARGCSASCLLLSTLHNSWPT